MKFGLITQWFDPEPGPASLPAELARELVRRGHDVQVVTGFPNYPTGRIYEGYRNRLRHDEVRDGVKVRRVGIWPSHDDSALGRVANYASFGVSALANGLDCLRDRDAVWVSNSPPTVVWVTHCLYQLGIPIVLHVMDLWPDNIESSGLVSSSAAGSAMLRVVNNWNSRLYGDAERILTISPSVGGLLAGRGVDENKVSYSPLWANEGVFRAGDGEATRRSMGVADDTVVVLYAGAIGELQGLDLLVNALAHLPIESSTKLECWFIGDGVWLPDLTKAVAAMPTTSARTRVLGRKPMAEMADWIAASDICYVGLKADQHATYSMPSKVQATLAMSKPLLAAVPGDVDDLVTRGGVGLSTGSGDPAILGRLLQDIVALGRPGLASLGERARQLYVDDFSLASGVTRVEEALVAVANPAEGNAEYDIDELTVDVAAKADIPAVVATHQRSFTGFFLTFLGPRFLELFYEELAADPGAVLLVTKRGSRTVGLVGGVQDEGAFFASLKQRRSLAFARAAAFAALRQPKIVPRLLRARRRDQEKDEAQVAATLLTIAVDPGEQGRGTAQILLAEYIRIMATRGVKSFTLTTDLSPDNRAIGFYEKNGLSRIRDFTTPEGRPMVEFLWSSRHDG